MRLTEQQITVIKHIAHAELGEGAQVMLFGSRVDDSAKGLSCCPSYSSPWQKSLALPLTTLTWLNAWGGLSPPTRGS
ncbi:hypothetical protein [Limnohabitans sp.]|uniref:hypothetical protein n=1 Tax=Limnohabitans sp. TaxID=1907725 RepID=UPI002FDE6EBB